MLTISQAIKQACNQFSQSETAKLDAEIILQNVLSCNVATIHAWPDRELKPEHLKIFQEYCSRRASGEPVAYILGYRDFWDLRLDVNHNTLIPRPETEGIVEWILNQPNYPDMQVLDLGTGSGAIAIAIAKHRPEWQVIATDISESALSVAENNAKKYFLKNIKFLLSNWFSKIRDQQFDYIVANPPYIDNQSKYLKIGDVRFEPQQALVSEDYGLADIKTITQQALSYLKPNGVLIFEHGYDQAESVRKIFKLNSFIDIETINDLSGIERITLGKKS